MLEEICELIYSAAMIAIVHNKNKNSNNQPTGNKNKNTKPCWEKRVETKITKLRNEIGQLTQYINGNLSVKKQRKVNLNYKNKDEIIDNLDKKT